MRQLDDMSRDEERALVDAALADRAARTRLQKLSRLLVKRLVRLYLQSGTKRSSIKMVSTAMGQFNAVLNDYGGRKARGERFSLHFAWWSTRRLEQFLREGR